MSGLDPQSPDTRYLHLGFARALSKERQRTGLSCNAGERGEVTQPGYDWTRGLSGAKADSFYHLGKPRYDPSLGLLTPWAAGHSLQRGGLSISSSPLQSGLCIRGSHICGFNQLPIELVDSVDAEPVDMEG